MAENTGVRIAVVGLGRMGRFHATTLSGRVPGARLSAVVDADTATASEVGQTHGVPWFGRLRDALGVVRSDAVVVATPAPSHEALVKECAAAGVPVLCEKPLAPTVAESERVCETVERSDIILQIGFQRRFDVGYSAMARQVASGDVGEVVMVKLSSRDPGLPSLEYLHSCGGIFVDQLIHDIDLLRFISHDEVVEVSAHGGAYFAPELADLGDADTVVVACRLSRGGLGVLDCSRQTGYGYEIAAEVFGTRATVRLEEKTDQGVRVYADGKASWTVPHFFAERFGTAFEEELRSFAQCVRSGTRPSPDACDGLAAMRIAEAAVVSLRQRSAVAL